MADDESHLVRSCLAGDTVGLRTFVERFQGMVFGLCFRMLGHREDAEDVAQEVLVRALRNLHQWDEVRPLQPWLLTIAANRCRTLLTDRSRRPRLSEFSQDVPDDHVPPMPSDLAEELQIALEKVREEYRICFILYHQQELSLAEISTIVGCPKGTIKTWLFRVRQELADHLQRRGFVPQTNQTGDA